MNDFERSEFWAYPSSAKLPKKKMTKKKFKIVIYTTSPNFVIEIYLNEEQLNQTENYLLDTNEDRWFLFDEEDLGPEKQIVLFKEHFVGYEIKGLSEE